MKVVFTERYRLQQNILGEWTDVGASDSRETLERTRRNSKFPDLYRVIDTEVEDKPC